MRRTHKRESATVAREHYRREKARRARRPRPDTDLMAAARLEYQAHLESQAAKGKGGRPKKTATRPPTPVEDEDS